MNAKEIAQKSAQAMWSQDHASKWFGMTLLDVDAGYAQMALTVQQEHCNGHGICHGGVSFALADSCFAFACNSYNESCVGQHTMVSYLRPIHLGERIIATANEIERGKKSGIYDVCVHNKAGQSCLQMRGFSHRVSGQLFET